MTTVLTAGARETEAIGRDAYELMRRLFPLCRSLTGDGVRATFDVLEEEIPITRIEIPSGTRVFDWIVPEEWNIRDAYIAAPDGTRVVDFRRSSLHVVSYSEPVRTTLPLDALRERLHTLPDQPEVIPLQDLLLRPHMGILPLAPPAARAAAGRLRGGDRLDARAGPPHLCGAFDRGRRRWRGPCLDLRLPPLARERQPVRNRRRHDARQGADGAAAAALLPLPVRTRHDRTARLAAREPRQSESA